MARVPVIGRLYWHEYLALVGSFLLITLEILVRTITLLLPGPVIRVCYRISRNAFNSLSSPHSRRSRNRKKSISSPIAQAQDFVELCELYGYYAEEHIVQTGDGYLLGLHRLGWRKGEEDKRVNAGPGSISKKVVYLHHGLMMNSEVWVCITEKERCLPFTLVEQGYDVWLGNNRGNKYSKKSVRHSPTEAEFWNFSMDQFAFHDIPDSIEYILSTTHQPSLSYIGFSQGTAQAFATLSIHPTLNSKIDVFVALAPAMAPPGLASGIVSSFVKSSPEILFLAFGRRAILGSATMWQAILYPGIFVYFIDASLSFLFGWRTRNITAHQKLAAYPHLYSFTSTKSVVHWFQIIRNGTFQMYDDEISAPLALSNSSSYYKVAKFPTRNIKTPIVLIHGGSDSLVDINLMLKELPKHTVAKGIQKYEHLDFLWASDVETLVFPHVLEALDSYAQARDTKQKSLGWSGVERGILDHAALHTPPTSGSQPPGYSDDECSRQTPTTAHTDASRWGVEDDRPSNPHEQLDESEDEEGSTPERFALTPQPTRGTPRRAHSACMGRLGQNGQLGREGTSEGGGTPGGLEAPSSPSTGNAVNYGNMVRASKPTRSERSDGTVKAETKRRIPSPRSCSKFWGNAHAAQQSDARPLDEERECEAPALSSPVTTALIDGRRSRPEGWWSSTDASAEPSPSPKASLTALSALAADSDPTGAVLSSPVFTGATSPASAASTVQTAVHKRTADERSSSSSQLSHKSQYFGVAGTHEHGLVLLGRSGKAEAIVGAVNQEAAVGSGSEREGGSDGRTRTRVK